MIQRQPGPRAVERWATTLAREDARNVWVVPWLENLGRDITYAFRVIVHRPAFAAAMILVMGVGIGATTGVFGLLDRLVLQSLPVHEPDRLVFLRNPGGRDFTDRDTSASTRVVLINESLARKIAGVGDPHRSKNHDRPQPIA